VNNEIIDQNNKSQIVHVNCLKIAHNNDLWKPKQHRNAKKKTREKEKKHLDEEEEDEFRIGSLPMQIPNHNRTESETPLVQTPNTPDPVQQMVETRLRKGRSKLHPSKNPPIPSRNAPHENGTPVTSSRARIMSKEE
jgi:hypothetical protein